MARVNWAAISAGASAVAAIAAALAAWTALVVARRLRRSDRLERADRALHAVYEAIVALVGTLTSGSSHRERQQAQLKVRGLVQIVRSPLPETAQLAALELEQIDSGVAAAAMAEVEQARQELWEQAGEVLSVTEIRAPE